MPHKFLKPFISGIAKTNEFDYNEYEVRMKVKSKIYRLGISTIVVAMIATCAGCSKNVTSGPETTVTPMPSPTTVEKDNNEQNTPASPTPQLTDKPDKEQEATPTIFDDDQESDDDIQANPTEAPTSAPDTDDGSDDEPDDVDVTATPTPTPKPESDAAARDKLWSETFFIRIPRFENGKLTGTGAEDTFDLAYFSDTSEDDINKYIEVLRERGFDQSVNTDTGAAGIIYEAHNADNWWALVNYANGELTLGSGFYEEKKSSSDILTELWTASALSYLPVFEEGEYAGSDISAGMTGAYVIFENVDADYVRGYIAQLEAAGFTLDADSGDSDGFIWHNAMNSEETMCDLTFCDGVIRLEAAQ